VGALVKKNFESIGVSFFETANAYYAADKKIQKMLTIENEHYLTDAMKSKGGVIILCSHFMPLMLGSRALSLKHSIANIYRPQNNRLFDKIMVKGLTNGGGTMIKNTDTKASGTHLTKIWVLEVVCLHHYSAFKRQQLLLLLASPKATTLQLFPTLSLGPIKAT
jgi:lauroyl/myristoyl acyltransferase